MFLQKPMLGTQLDHSDSLNNPALDLLMNEGHGDVVHDLSGYGNHGTLHNFAFPPTRTSGWNPGVDGVALTLDGTDDFIDCGNDPSLNLTSAFAIEAVVVPDSSMTGNYYYNVIAKDSIYSNGYGLAVYGSEHQIVFWSRAGGTIGNCAWDYLDISNIAGKLCDTIGVFDGVNQLIYINGQLKNSVSGVTPASSSFPLRVGYSGNPQSFDTYFKGAIPRARILPYTMSPFDVMQRQINPYGAYLQ